jgi:hypothetical protein
MRYGLNNEYTYIMVSVCGRKKYVVLIPLGIAGTALSAICLGRVNSPNSDLERKYTKTIKAIGNPLFVITGAVCLFGPTLGLITSFIVCNK